MTPNEMHDVFSAHRRAEEARDIDAILATFTDDCYVATTALGTRSDGRTAVAAYYRGLFAAFPDLEPVDEGFAYGDDCLVTWGQLSGTSSGDWRGAARTGKRFELPFTNIATFKHQRMHGETSYFDLATLCHQAQLPLETIRQAPPLTR